MDFTESDKIVLLKALETYSQLIKGNLQELQFLYWDRINNHNLVDYAKITKQLKDCLFPENMHINNSTTEIADRLIKMLKGDIKNGYIKPTK